MKLYRGIAGDKINTEEIGVSWSFCAQFAEEHAENIARARGIKGIIVLSIDIEATDERIDIDNTLTAMDCRPEEFEVVLNGSIDCEVYATYGVELSIDTFSGHTGANTFEDYTDGEYQGELTAEHFYAEAAGWENF